MTYQYPFCIFPPKAVCNHRGWLRTEHAVFSSWGKTTKSSLASAYTHRATAVASRATGWRIANPGMVESYSRGYLSCSFLCALHVQCVYSSVWQGALRG